MKISLISTGNIGGTLARKLSIWLRWLIRVG
jgi:predicted dinucleotide-binding enzyme